MKVLLAHGSMSYSHKTFLFAAMYIIIISEAGDLKNQACYLDAWDSTWKSCSELCRTDRIQASTSQRMKCRDYCPCE